MNRILLILVLSVLIWSGINPHDYLTWAMEVTPVLIALPVLLLTHKKFPLTPLVYTLITLQALILMVGGHYTYALTPLGEWAKDLFGFERNNYDRLGHFIQGFVPAMVARELLLRTSPLKAGKWMFTIIVMSCLGIAAAYELLEWLAAVTCGQAAEAFLGTQGDVWDTQKDMFLAGLGATIAQLGLAGLHDKQLNRQKNDNTAYMVRHLQGDEWQAFKTIRLTALQTNPSVFGSTYAREEGFTDTDWQQWVGNKKSPCFILYEGHKPIGCTGMVTDRNDASGETAVLIASFILPEYRGQGLSELLYKARINYARENGYWKKIIVGHREGNEASRRANQKHGFTFTHRSPKTWPDGITQDELCYVLHLENT